jgi:hypothetical protein
MIRYAMKCAAEHGFDSWFQSADAYDGLIGSGRVTCPVCGSADVAKALMAPAVRSPREGVGEGPLEKPASEMEAMIAALRRQIEENSEYVGLNFAAEARSMHEGEAPERPIYGEARPDEARALIEDGVPVAPLPFIPARKAN